VSIKPVQHRDHDAVCRNFAEAVPKVKHLSANQIFNRMERPRMRTMRHVEQTLEDLAADGMVDVKVCPGAGQFRVYRWLA
jgi:hypothetical protein